MHSPKRLSPLPRQRFLTPYLFLLPAMVILGLTVFYPALQAFYLSFTSYEYDLTQTPQWVGLANFQRLLSDRVFWQTLGNTFIYLLGVVPILVFAPLGLAILVNRQLRLINWFRLALYTPVVISIVVAGVAWRAIYKSNGLLNQFWQQLDNFAGGLLSWLLQPMDIDLQVGIPWLTSPKLVLWSVMAVTIWKGLGYYMVIYLAGLQTIAPELYEAAAIDGSDGLLKHWDITLPLMRPYLLLVAVISAISATKVFEEIYIMTQGGPGNSSKTVVYYLWEQGFQYLEISYACAMGLVLFLVILVFSWLNLQLSSYRNPYRGI